jgi:O-acetyl-ADP-ribose deacetylase (regulator of RNase III)
LVSDTIFPNTIFHILVGDLTKQDVDAIVNAANSSLMGGGGVDGAIHRAGGPAILAACREIRAQRYPDGLPTWRSGDHDRRKARRAPRDPHRGTGSTDRTAGRDAELLAACYENSIALAAREGLKTIAFPAVSTGVYGYPKDEAAKVSRTAIERALLAHPSIREVRLVFFSEADAAIARRE